MTNNDVLRSLRFVLNVNEAKLIAIMRLVDCEVSRTTMAAWLKAEDEEGYRRCDDVAMSYFLNGLVVHKRGQDLSRPAPTVETPVSNNLVAKKVRTAFQLKDDDLMALVGAAGMKVSKAELSAIFRGKEHRNYRECGDQFLRYLFRGLATRPAAEKAMMSNQEASAQRL